MHCQATEEFSKTRQWLSLRTEQTLPLLLNRCEVLRRHPCRRSWPLRCSISTQNLDRSGRAVTRGGEVVSASVKGRLAAWWLVWRWGMTRRILVEWRRWCVNVPCGKRCARRVRRGRDMLLRRCWTRLSWRCTREPTLFDLIKHRLLYLSCYLSNQVGIDRPGCI
jgi:hypothetical protein